MVSTIAFNWFLCGARAGCNLVLALWNAELWSHAGTVVANWAEASSYALLDFMGFILCHALASVYLDKQHKCHQPKAFIRCRGFRSGTVTGKCSSGGLSRWYNLRAILCTKLCRPSATSASFLPTLLCAQREEPTTLAWALESLWAEGWRCVQRTWCRTMPPRWCPDFHAVSLCFLPPAKRWISQLFSLLLYLLVFSFVLLC